MKRLFDIISSSTAIILLLPIIILVAILVKITSKGPMIFKQKRSGKNRREFYIYKFRTMKVSTPSDVPTSQLGNSDKYITKFGSFLRKTSLDELPQLFNILKGDMSLVGPRPVILNEVELLDEREKNGATSVRPGLTGLAQINGRDLVTVSEKAKLDAEYVSNRSFFYDINILMKTVFVVLKSDGVSEGSDKHKDIGVIQSNKQKNESNFVNYKNI